MLCQRCQELLTSSVEVSGFKSFPHQTSLQDLKVAVEARCMICATIWFQYTPDEQQKLSQFEKYEFETYGLTNSYVNACVNADLHLEFVMSLDAVRIINIPRLSIDFRARKETDEEKSLGQNRLILDYLQFSASTDSPEVFPLAK
ncbi:hypothetical protein FLAG1_08630 [Fusarium langsethiae]|uniref:Uncharacterized protein n=1 Tax=Fusarium langsethiae TaxID=179993 RepID=A0A0M9ERT5_FUSLA|nr:hypothetical protein FLAG1_08630 [Fusarium langsethiae]